MLIVICGTGASYDSLPSQLAKRGTVAAHLDRPALADELFANRARFLEIMQRFPACLPIVPYLQQRPSGRTVENILEELRDESPEYPERIRQLASVRYYLQALLSRVVAIWTDDVGKGITSYKTLLDQIERWRKGDRVCLVTFNYDTMLEDGLSGLSIRFFKTRDYVSPDSPYWLIKPHGSVNWRREIEHPAIDVSRPPEIIDSEVIAKAHQLRLTQNYVVVPEATMRAKPLPLFPAIAIPVETKSEYECPPEHLDKLCECLPNATRILVIGWRATERHFLKLLAEKLPANVRWLVVAGGAEGAQEVIGNLKAAGIQGDYQACDSGFSRFVVHREGDGFLGS